MIREVEVCELNTLCRSGSELDYLCHVHEDLEMQAHRGDSKQSLLREGRKNRTPKQRAGLNGLLGQKDSV